MSALKRFIGAFSGAKLTDEPSEADVKEFNVMNYSLAIVNSSKPVHKSSNPSRFIFLRHGVVGYCSKGTFSPRSALENVLSNQKENSRTFYIAPTVDISRDVARKKILLTNNESKWENVSWLGSTKRIGEEWMEFTFSTDAQATEWENELREMLNFSPLPRSISSSYRSDTEFPRRLNAIVWTVMQRTENFALKDFYLNNLVDKITPEQGVMDRSDDLNCVPLFERIVKNLKEMVGGVLTSPNEDLLAFTLTKMCAHPVDRLVLLLCSFRPDALRAIETKCRDRVVAAVRGADLVKGNVGGPIWSVGYLLTLVPPQQRNVILMLFNHPSMSGSVKRAASTVASTKQATAQFDGKARMTSCSFPFVMLFLPIMVFILIAFKGGLEGRDALVCRIEHAAQRPWNHIHGPRRGAFPAIFFMAHLQNVS